MAVPKCGAVGGRGRGGGDRRDQLPPQREQSGKKSQFAGGPERWGERSLKESRIHQSINQSINGSISQSLGKASCFFLFLVYGCAGFDPWHGCPRPSCCRSHPSLCSVRTGTGPRALPRALALLSFLVFLLLQSVVVSGGKRSLWWTQKHIHKALLLSPIPTGKHPAAACLHTDVQSKSKPPHYPTLTPSTPFPPHVRRRYQSVMYTISRHIASHSQSVPSVMPDSPPLPAHCPLQACCGCGCPAKGAGCARKRSRFWTQYSRYSPVGIFE